MKGMSNVQRDDLAQPSVSILNTDRSMRQPLKPEKKIYKQSSVTPAPKAAPKQTKGQ